MSNPSTLSVMIDPGTLLSVVSGDLKMSGVQPVVSEAIVMSSVLSVVFSTSLSLLHLN
jgi:hypothetical protein